MMAIPRPSPAAQTRPCKDRTLRSRLAQPLGILLLLALVGFFAGCKSGADTGQMSGAADSAANDQPAVGAGSAGADTSGDGTEDEGEQKKEKAISVDVGDVVRGELVVPIYADGVIRTPRSVEIRTKAAGELVAVNVQDGDRVKAKQLLAMIDQREYILALEESRYRHFQALSQIAAEEDTFAINHEALRDFTQRRTELERLRSQGHLSVEEYQAKLLELELNALNKGAFRQEVFEQRTGLAESRAAEARAQLNLENTEIRAPFAGVIQGLKAVPGEIVGNSAVICSIYNNESLEAVVNVLEADLGNLVEGRPVLLAVAATGDTLQARVDVISPNLDQVSRTCEVIIRFQNPDGRYRPGMFVRAEIAGWIYPDRLLVPKAAVLTRDGRPLVFKVNDDKAQWLYVDTGLENDSWFEILQVHSGGTLEPGDRVVVSNHLTLAHEAKIKIHKAHTPEDRWAFAAISPETTP